MVVKTVIAFIEKQKNYFKLRDKERKQEENFRQTEDMRAAEEIKKEADRLAQLKQYKTSIEEYHKALSTYPLKGQEEDLYTNAAEFLFKVNYNIAACHSYLNQFDDSIAYFNTALKLNNVDEENKVKAFMGLGMTHVRKKLLVDGKLFDGPHISEGEIHLEKIDEKKIDEYRKEDAKYGLLKLAHECFLTAAQCDKNNIDAWYNKGHMEFLLGKVKDAVQSFDTVLNLNKNYQNKENIRLFDEIKLERGIAIPASEISLRESRSETLFRTKTGHLVKNRAELAIANFLYENGLMFEYNNVATWADKDDFRPSFYIPKLDVYVEHFGLEHIKEYEKIMKAKIKQYDKHKKKSIHLTTKDEQNIQEVLKLKLKPYIVL